eukprot:TRINITY_DN9949_c0_g1_i1.p1 TRINITY_DN9949_c0_g1~~TRINITY_DN9949_c0_g1_i1.p1  ORF type:complete len:588 (-),score=125.34 TRINITY_DN9949_c0_g1_i1:6-1736(-)
MADDIVAVVDNLAIGEPVAPAPSVEILKQLFDFVLHDDFSAFKSKLESLPAFDLSAALPTTCSPTGGTLLHIAVRNQTNDFITLLLEKGAKCGVRDINGVSPFSVAVALGNMTLCNQLIASGANIADDDAFPLMFAVLTRKRDLVQLILSLKANPNATANDQTTALHLAAADDVEIVKLLLEAGANVNAPDGSGLTPLWIAAQFGRTDICDALVKGGADVNVVALTRGHATPLLAALVGAYADTARVLLAAGANVHAKVDPAAKCESLAHVVLVDVKRMLELLKEFNAPLDVPNTDGLTPLMAAASVGRDDIVSALLDAGADMNLRNERCGTALCVAVMSGQVRCVKALLDHDAEPDIGDREGRTPLILAAMAKNRVIFRMLLKANASANTRDTAEQSATDYAAKSSELADDLSSFPATVISVPRYTVAGSAAFGYVDYHVSWKEPKSFIAYNTPRRYKEFKKMHAKLQTEQKISPLASFPGARGVRGIFAKKTDPAYLESRRSQLEMFLREVYEKYPSSAVVKAFLSEGATPTSVEPPLPPASDVAVQRLLKQVRKAAKVESIANVIYQALSCKD